MIVIVSGYTIFNIPFYHYTIIPLLLLFCFLATTVVPMDPELRPYQTIEVTTMWPPSYKLVYTPQ